MKNCKLFILAQGKDIKWKPTESLPKYKFQLLVGEDTILDRNIKLFRELNPIVIIHSDYPHNIPATYYSYKSPGMLLHGIVSTKNNDLGWNANRIIILFGDVVFSRYAVSTILEDTALLSLYGRRGENFVTGKLQSEIFGLSVYRDLQPDVGTALYWLWRAAVTYGYASNLWSLYYYIKNEQILKEFGDYTDDIDSVDEYNSFGEYLFDAVERDK